MIAVDIEAVPNEQAIQSEAWAEYKEKHEGATDEDAALHPAFAQIVCICAYDELRKKTFGECTGDEKALLSNFGSYLEDCRQNIDPVVLGGHNIKGYDIPMMGGRTVSNLLVLPKCLRVAGKKPWEIPHVDTMELLKFGSGRAISLDAMCLMLGVPSPKRGPVTGSSVWEAFKAGRFDEIKEYCGKDVNAWWHCKNKIVTLGVMA